MADVVSLFGDNCSSNEAYIDINGVIDGLINDRDELQDILIVGINKDAELDIRSSLGFTESYFLAYRAKQFFLKYKIGDIDDQ